MASVIALPPLYPITEKYEWLTDVIEHRDGTEQRLKIRHAPRQTLEYTYRYKQSDKQSIFNLLHENLRGEWDIPLWPYAQSVGSITAGQTIIPCDTLVTDFTDRVMLYCRDSYQISDISSIHDTNIIMSAPAEYGMTNAYIVPMRSGFILGEPTNNTNGISGDVTVRFFVTDVEDIVGVEPGQYLGEDIYYDPGIKYDTFVDMEFSQLHDVNDFGVGPVSHSSPWGKARYSVPYSAEAVTPELTRTYLEFLFRRAGKYRCFYFPTFNNDITIKEYYPTSSMGFDLSDSSTSTDFNLSFKILIVFPQPIGIKNIAVLSGNSWTPFAVDDIVNNGDGTALVTLSDQIETAVDKISILGYNRLITDAVAIKHVAPGTAESTIRITSL